MYRRFAVLFALAVAVAMAPDAANAAYYLTYFCFQYEVDYTDASGGDWWTTSSDKIAYGIQVQIDRPYENETDFYGYVNASSGCVGPMNLSSNAAYRITVYSKVKPGANYVRVVNNDEDDTRYYQVVDSAFIPSATGIYTYTYQLSSLRVSNIAAAAGRAIGSNSGGLSGETFTLFNSPDGDGNNSSGANGVYLNTNGRNRKFIMAHELGHQVGRKRDEDSGAYKTYSADADPCFDDGGSDHHLNSKEDQTAGAVEGFAQYYAAVIWNNTSENDCQFYYWHVPFDFDRDGTYDSSVMYDCETALTVGHNYLESRCTPDIEDRSVEYDWLAFWWDMNTNGGLSTTGILDIWDAANPHNWSSSNVYSRLRTAAINAGVSSSTWDYWAAHNGVDH